MEKRPDNEHVERMIRIATGKEPRYEQVNDCGRCGTCCENEACEHLSYDGEIAVCAIYEDRPTRCREFPVGPPVVYETCSYRFKDLVDDTVLGEKEVR